MQTIRIHEFAKQAADLKPGQEIRFQVPYEDADQMDYFITIITRADSDCLYANCVGGGDPFVFDLSTYDATLRELTALLDSYVNGKAGKAHSYGFVNVADTEHTETLKPIKKGDITEVCYVDDSSFSRNRTFFDSPDKSLRPMSIWAEIRNHHDELDGFEDEHDLVKCIAIDAYIDDDDETPGAVIAKVILSKHGDVGVIYIENLARSDAYAQEIILSTVANIKDSQLGACKLTN